ncbi:MAG: right-handed parallel beta-helix repeat-containing protein [Candidatus Lokiarchaeota archaeon]|nr:right-handed parallel beta-helix repeat-containing protein [Candidatus Lokiarchaeota archaeon]
MENVKYNDLKRAEYWYLTGAPILIDDSDPLKSWAFTAATYEWCSGSGTWSDPYSIENTTIDGLSIGDCLVIKNTNDFFQIKNCTILNSAGSWEYGGIKIINSQNGLLVNNLLQSVFAGIYLDFSNNIRIVDNIAIDNSYGIRFRESDYNNISFNTFYDIFDGLDIEGDYNFITNNHFYDIRQTAIFISGFKNVLRNNMMQKGGINIGGSITEKASADIDTSNLINGKPFYFYSNQKGLMPDDFLNASQVRLVNCSDSIITDLSISQVVHGLSLDYCHNITIKNCIFSNNIVIGVLIKSGSSNNIIFNNTIQNNGDWGIYLYNTETSNNIVYFNIIRDNKENALDYGTNNYWDNGSIGNYWSDYSGCDLNNDGIGDVAYEIEDSNGQKDYFPIWNDGDLIYSIYIDDQETGLGARTWEWLSQADWCNGTGSYNDPYVIDGLILTGTYEASRFEIRNSRKFFEIKNCIIADCGGGHGSRAGIKLVNTTNGFIHGNEIINNRANGIYLLNSSRNNITNNIIHNNNMYGIYSDQGHHNNISKNDIYGDMVLGNSDYNYIEGNFIKNIIRGRDGLILYEVCRNNVITNNEFENCGIVFSDFYNEVYKEDLISNTISPSNLVNGKPIYFYSSLNNLSSSNFTNAGQIILVDCENCTIAGFEFAQNDQSLSLYFCSNILIENNFVNENKQNGIYLYESFNNKISNNTIINSYSFGIRLQRSVNNRIYNNTLKLNQNTGIYLGEGSDGNSIMDNIVSNNSDNGMYFFRADNNTIFRNKILSNGFTGIHFQDTSSNNMIYLNEFHDNPTQAGTVQSSNQWDNGSIGNYWSDYVGKDVNDDGIGDSPYINISSSVGSIDNYPIWWDPPEFSIEFPLTDEIYGNISPEVNITIHEGIMHSFWYILNDVIMSDITTILPGEISQNLWNSVPNGTVLIKFFVNDSRGYISSREVKVRKDILAPIITINFPYFNNIFNNNTPNYSFSIIEGNLDSIWYRLTNGTFITENVSITSLSGYIEQELWNLFGNGSVIIQFFANDTLDNIGYSEVFLRKDILVPQIFINSPDTNDLYGTNIPKYNITVIEENLHSTWYRLTNGTFITTNIVIDIFYGSIDQSIWDQMGNGTVILQFFVNDTAGNFGYTEVLVRKEVTPPIITINLPILNELFGFNVPSYNITIIEENLDSTWFRLNGDTIITDIITIEMLYGSIEQLIWDQVGNGTIIIEFYANDTLGNIGYSEMVIRKDVLAPIISIIKPLSNEVFGASAPPYEIIFEEGNLAAFWYTIENSSLITIINNFNGTINQNLWDSLPEGQLTIRFYANDTLGQLTVKEIIVYKSLINDLEKLLETLSPIILTILISALGITIIVIAINKGAFTKLRELLSKTPMNKEVSEKIATSTLPRKVGLLYCPNCHSKVDFKKSVYCTNCGQIIRRL